MRRSQVPSLKKKRLLGQSSSTDTDQSTSSLFKSTPSYLKSSSKSTDQSNHNLQVFTVVYGQFKPGKKKKEWSDDAILVLEDKKILIFNLEGECISKGAYDKNRPIRQDDILLIHGKEYMIIDPVSKDDYLSKRCFHSGFSVEQSQIDNQPPQNLKRKLPDYVDPFQRRIDKEDVKKDEDQSMEKTTKLMKRSFDSSKKENDKHQVRQVFKVLYGDFKPGKKHKEWKYDGIISRDDRNVTLYNEEGDKIGTDLAKKEKPFKYDDIILIGGKEVQIHELIDLEDFDTKRCFQQNYCVPIQDSNQIDQSITNLSSFKKVITNETIITNETKLTAKNDDDYESEDSFIEPDPFELCVLMPHLPDSIREIRDDYTLFEIDLFIAKYLREHQIEGIKFMYKCIVGFYSNINGCILADEMGLGKTLQCITLIYTLLKKGPFRVPFFENRVLILTPSSLVKNWSKEFDKWLKEVRFYTYPVDEKHTIKDYLKKSKSVFPVLIVSYDTFYRNFKLLENVSFDLIVCDEGHRLKNSKTKIFETIRNMKCERRILLTGTPIQNNLGELFALSDLVNPGLLGTKEEFYEEYEKPILMARKERDESEINSSTCSSEIFDGTPMTSSYESDIHRNLFEKIKLFFMRRLSSSFNYLPKRIDRIVICHLSDMQKKIYEALLNDKKLKQILGQEFGATVVRSYLPYILFLRKLCNHPFLINAEIIKRSYNLDDQSLISQLLPIVSDIFSTYKHGAIDKSGKFDVLFGLLKSIDQIKEKVVIVSHFTQTLDLIQQYCKLKNYSTTRLDGSTPINKRQKLVDDFNSESNRTFIFLLSSKAGGLGLNLIGASHIILYDLDWNPSHDEQSMCRIVRDGQKKTANIYRLLTVGTIEEKIFQRQLDKQNLNVAIGSDSREMQLSNRELKDIFRLDTNTKSSTHDALNCNCIKEVQSATSPSNQIEEKDESTDNLNNLSETNDNQQSNQSNTENEQQSIRIKIKQENLEPNSTDEESSSDESSEETNEIRVKEERIDREYDSDVNSSDAFDEEFYDKDKSDKEDDKIDEPICDNLSDEEDSKLCLNLIKTIDDNETGSKSEYDLDEESINEESMNKEIDVSNKDQQTKVKPLIKWRHFSYPFDQSDVCTMLLELKDKITFVFQTETK